MRSRPARSGPARRVVRRRRDASGARFQTLAPDRARFAIGARARPSGRAVSVAVERTTRRRGRLMFGGMILREAILNPFILIALVSLAMIGPAVAEKLVDPVSVAPEYRDAAAKRRAEQIEQYACAHKADLAKVMPRDRTAFLLQCLETDARK